MSQLMHRDPVFGPVDRMFRTLTRDPFGFANGVAHSLAESLSEESRPLAIDISDGGDDLVIEASLPGYQREHIDISVDDGVLSIVARKEDEHEETAVEGVGENATRYFRRERRFGTLSRRISLPETVDSEQVNATLADGVLTLRLPKTQKTLPRKIEIS